MTILTKLRLLSKFLLYKNWKMFSYWVNI